MLSPSDRLVIVGASGHGRVIADIAARAGVQVLGFIDADPAKTSCSGHPVLGTETDLSRLSAELGIFDVVVAVGDNATRWSVVRRLEACAPDIGFAALAHPAATIASGVALGAGTVVMAGAVINPGTRVGRHCILNTGAVIDHECRLDDYVTVSPRACLGGGVQIGTGAVVGLGASVIHGITIGEHAILGAGAVAVRDIPARVVALGVPARVVRRRTADDEPYL